MFSSRNQTRLSSFIVLFRHNLHFLRSIEKGHASKNPAPKVIPYNLLNTLSLFFSMIE